MLVTVAVGKSAAVHDDRVVQKRSGAVWKGILLAQEVSKSFGMELVDPRKFFDLLLATLMMREAVMGLGYADLAIGTVALLQTHN